jgi:hypothetical protein
MLPASDFVTADSVSSNHQGTHAHTAPISGSPFSAAYSTLFFIYWDSLGDAISLLRPTGPGFYMKQLFLINDKVKRKTKVIPVTGRGGQHMCSL